MTRTTAVHRTTTHRTASHRTARRRTSMRAAGGAVLATSLLLTGCAGGDEEAGETVDEAVEVDAEEQVPAEGEIDVDEDITEEDGAAAAGDPEDIDEGSVESTAGEPTVETEAFFGDLASYVGETVVVEATVADVLGEVAFTVDDDAAAPAIGEGESVLVLGEVGGLEEGMPVVVSGQLRDGFDAAQAEQVYDAQLPVDQLEDYADGLWLDAAAVEVQDAATG